MHPHKTALGQQVLATHRTPLHLRQRRVLILCDGQRSVADLTRLVGEDTPALVRLLHAAGYLAGDDDAEQPATHAQPATPDMQSEVVDARPTRRRSLSAARMYLQDMLELQRNEVAQLLRRRLLMAHEENAIVAALLEALAELPRFTAEGYARRVRERVADVLPEPYLPALAALDTGTVGAQ